MQVVFYNGNFVSDKDAVVSKNNRAFNYGDGFFETIKLINSELFNFSSHMRRIRFAMSVLKLNDNYTSLFLKEKISYLLKVNNISNGSVKVHISRSGAGRYTPESNDPDLLISTISGSRYKNNDPISLCFYEEEYKASGLLSNIKSVNSLISVLASIYSDKNNFDNAILLNNSGNIIEVSNANIYMLRDDIICTPRLSDGCVDGTMRNWVNEELDICEKLILKEELLDAKEVFITNASYGITSIKNIEKTYFNCFNTAHYLQSKLINLNLGL